MIHLLNWGMGVESTAILVRWIKEPGNRPFRDFEELVVLVAQTGNERQVTKDLCEKYVLPLMTEHRIRLVQVCRNGDREAEGYTVLSDTDQPQILHIEVPYPLGDHFIRNGTIQRLGKPHFCAMKWKGFVLDRWIGETIGDSGFGPYIGYNRDELNRVASSNDYGCRAEKYLYPLVEWNWSRADCLSYLLEQFEVIWEKSCCTFCPFQSKAEIGERWQGSTLEELVTTLDVAEQAIAFNPRMKLFGTRSAMDVAQVANSQAVELWRSRLKQRPWTVYRVRRIYKAKAFCDRCIDFALENVPQNVAESYVKQLGNWEQDAWVRSWQRHRIKDYPTVEEFHVAAPSGAIAKVRHRANFERKWEMLTGQYQQLRLCL